MRNALESTTRRYMPRGYNRRYYEIESQRKEQKREAILLLSHIYRILELDKQKRELTLPGARVLFMLIQKLKQQAGPDSQRNTSFEIEGLSWSLFKDKYLTDSVKDDSGVEVYNVGDNIKLMRSSGAVDDSWEIVKKTENRIILNSENKVKMFKSEANLALSELMAQIIEQKSSLRKIVLLRSLFAVYKAKLTHLTYDQRVKLIDESQYILSKAEGYKDEKSVAFLNNFINYLEDLQEQARISEEDSEIVEYI